MDCVIDHDEIKDILISKRSLWLAGENTIEHLSSEIDRNLCWLIIVGASFWTLLSLEDCENSTSWYWQCIKIKIQYEKELLEWNKQLYFELMFHIIFQILFKTNIFIKKWIHIWTSVYHKDSEFKMVWAL